MKKLQMNKYGKFLVGREFSKSAMKRIAKDIEYPVYLDFAGVTSITTSFADEVLVPIAKNQGNNIQVINVKILFGNVSKSWPKTVDLLPQRKSCKPTPAT